MINECGHSICKNCVENLFVRNTGPCPTCGKTLKKNTFWEQIFDDPLVEKENHIRKKLKKVYNLQEDDFDNPRQFNDYLENFEVLVANLTNGIDVEESEQEVDKFKKNNTERIERNRRRLNPDQLWIQRHIEDEERTRRRINQGQSEEVVEKKIDGQSIIDELKESNLPAEVILDRERKRQIEAGLAEKMENAQKKLRRIEQKRSLGVDSQSFVPLRPHGAPFDYRMHELNLNGPIVPDIHSLATLGYLQHMRTASESRLAGGFTTEMGCSRALFDSRVDLYALG